MFIIVARNYAICYLCKDSIFAVLVCLLGLSFLLEESGLCLLKILFYICTMIDNTKIKFVEEEVIKTYNITRDELMSYDKHKNICMARMMCIYILHNDFGISSSYLSKRYNRSRRVIFSICQKMKAITKTYIKDKELYTHLKEVVFSI